MAAIPDILPTRTAIPGKSWSRRILKSEKTAACICRIKNKIELLLRAVKGARRAEVPGCTVSCACATSRHDSGKIRKETGQPAERRYRGDTAELSSRARVDQARRVAGRGLR